VAFVYVLAFGSWLAGKAGDLGHYLRVAIVKHYRIAHDHLMWRMRVSRTISAISAEVLGLS
jgi:hypothetical protein